MTKRVAFLMMLIFFLFSTISQSKAIEHEKTLLQFYIKASPQSELKTSLYVENQMIMKAIKEDTFVPLTYPTSFTDIYLKYEALNQEHELQVDRFGNIFSKTRKQKLDLNQEVKTDILKYIAILKSNHYGDLISWENVDRLLPKMAIFEVIDLETGLSFNVQRRAGNMHADVQPLSFEDTKILKKLYHGKWSWERKAILVKMDDKLIAASMHGMPHGIGSLRNGFPGHFCIHFYKSTTHKTKIIDPTHQIMVYKAAGRIDEYLDGAKPLDIIDIYLMAINQEDENLLKILYSNDTEFKLPDELVLEIKDIDWISRHSEYKDVDYNNKLFIEVPVNLTVSKNGALDRRKVIFLLRRNSFYEPWKVANVI